MNNILKKKNKILKYLGRTLPIPEKYIYSKLGNELIFIGTKRCNLNCVHCYDKANLPNFNSRVNKELTTFQIYNLITILNKLGVNNIRLTGGEIILRPDFLKILSFAKKMNVTLCTNGKDLKPLLSKIIKIHPNNLIIHFSIDGLKTHNEIRVGSDYKKIFSLIQFIKTKYPSVHITVNTLITQKNVWEIPYMYSLLQKLGVNFWSISFPRMVDTALKRNFKLPNISVLTNSFLNLLEIYYSTPKKLPFSFSYFYKEEFKHPHLFSIPKINSKEHPCMPDCNGSKGLIIDSFGNIVDCLALKPSLKKPINLKSILNQENVSEEDFSKLLYDSLKSDFYKLNVLDNSLCANCRYLNLCKSGCPANSFYLTGSLNNPDLISCLMFSNFERNILPHMNKKDKEFYKKNILKNKSPNNLINYLSQNRKILEKINLTNPNRPL
jgi:radical SAM protein with 4Fe4S-binding SPASM domain